MKLLLVFLLSLLIVEINPILTKECLKEERDALLSFKASVNDPSNQLSSWHGQDCCNWWGVGCDNSTGYVMKLNLRNPYQASYSEIQRHALTGEINPSLLGLRHLTQLDLSMNDFSTISIPEFMGSFENLMYLNLSYSGFIGAIPYQLGNLSKLRYLDLRDSEFTGQIPPHLGNLSNLIFLNLKSSFYDNFKDNLSWISQLSSLRFLDMSYLRLNNSIHWFEINRLQMLETLILSDCSIGGNIPAYFSYVNLTSLRTLDLSWNFFEANLPPWLWNLTSLLSLDLGGNSFNGTVPDALSNLTLLNYLSLEGNNFSPTFPKPVKHLCNLKSINLGYLEIGGDVDKLFKKLSCAWFNLEEVRLAGNNIRGNIPSWIQQMTNLTFLELSYNSLSGPVPREIGRLSKLTQLDLSSNSVSGIITEAHLANLTQLKVLSLSQNPLTILLNNKWVPPFQLYELSAFSCVLFNGFPKWLKWQTQLDVLTLSNTSISGIIPSWFWKLPLKYVDLSQNRLSGKLPKSLQATLLNSLDMSSNNLEGPLPLSYSHILRLLDLSNNYLSGIIPSALEMTSLNLLYLSKNRINGKLPSSVCNMTCLDFLDLSYNSISGELPNCWKGSNLDIIDLSNNNLVGEIPDSIGSLSELSALQLSNNALDGELPFVLQHCKNLVFLDLGSNKFSGKIPTWVGETLQNLVVLVLRLNMLSDNIPSELGLLENLQVLDLSHNNLSGSIPHSLGKLNEMRNKTSYSSSYAYKTFQFGPIEKSTVIGLYIELKGQELYYSKTLSLVKMLDFSSNNLSGDISKSLLSLQALISLNLSRNHLVGRIPDNIGEMQSLESLDFSFNELQGTIPESLSKLSALSHLNLSYNNFSGEVPSGRQLDTLNDSSIYVGNAFLCGPPTENKCLRGKANNTNFDVHEHGHELEMIWHLKSIVMGFIVGFWSVCGALLFKSVWRMAYFQMVDGFFDNMYVRIVITVRRLSRRIV